MAFFAPIGTEEERASGIIWPGRWEDATGYDKLYENGWHTGADLNLNHPHWDLNRHAEVYAMGDGEVTYARRYHNPKSWGNVIVIDHGEFEGKPLLSRYGHIEDMTVKEGQKVSAGEPVANVGNGDGLFAYHLHFDISTTTMLRTEPGNWPGVDRGKVLAHYVNPEEWLQMHVTSGLTNLNLALMQIYYVSTTAGLRVRQDHRKSALQVGSLKFTKRVYLNDTGTVNEDGFCWAQITRGPFTSDWLAMGKEDLSDMFVSRFSPAG